MRKTIGRVSIAILFMVGGATGLAAQSGVDADSHVYIFAGFGRPTSEATGFKITYGGLGWEGASQTGVGAFGIGIEGGFSRGVAALTPAAFASGSFLYRVPTIAERISLFMNVGGTIAGGYETSTGSNGGVHFGGGVNYWFADKVALRVDYRGYRYLKCDGCTVNTARIGFSFALDD